MVSGLLVACSLISALAGMLGPSLSKVPARKVKSQRVKSRSRSKAKFKPKAKSKPKVKFKSKPNLSDNQADDSEEGAS